MMYFKKRISFPHARPLFYKGYSGKKAMSVNNGREFHVHYSVLITSLIYLGSVRVCDFKTCDLKMQSFLKHS
jgi:hypothetical protein